jgi:3',5'-cyclic AMP phosphodiesterase CpdA
MRKVIAHLSDLHFGRVDPATVEPILEAVRDLKPDVVAISGDLTQRARRQEFEDARRFLARLPEPRIVVPGNHDVPLHNPWSRFISGLALYREYISSDAEPIYVDEAIAVVGVNTARALTWKGGRINRTQIERVRARFCEIPAGVVRAVVVHHPLDLPEAWGRTDRARRARRAFREWADCGIDLILAGHIHRAFTGAGRRHHEIDGEGLAGAETEVLRIGDHRAVVVQAGTAISTRGRGEPNSFNTIEIGDTAIAIAQHTWDGVSHRFHVSERREFSRALTRF